MNPNTQNDKSASSTNTRMIRLNLFMVFVWTESAQPFTPNVQGHPRSPVARLVPERSDKHEA
jgi:hypothetical protein